MPATRNTTPAARTPMTPETPVTTVLGTTLVAIGAVPTLMGLGPDGSGYLLGGAIIVATGAALIVAGRVRRRRLPGA